MPVNAFIEEAVLHGVVDGGRLASANIGCCPPPRIILWSAHSSSTV